MVAHLPSFTQYQSLRAQHHYRIAAAGGDPAGEDAVTRMSDRGRASFQGLRR